MVGRGVEAVKDVEDCLDLRLPPRRAAPKPSLRPEGSRRYPPLTVLSVLGSALSAFQGPAQLIFATLRMPVCHVGKMRRWEGWENCPGSPGQ